jgi:hypothetical protein
MWNPKEACDKIPAEEHEHHIRLKSQDEFAEQNKVRKLSGTAE